MKTLLILMLVVVSQSSQRGLIIRKAESLDDLPNVKCVVETTGSKERARIRCGDLILRVDSKDPAFEDWLLVKVSENQDPVVKPLDKGQELRAYYDKKFAFLIPIASCEARVQMRVMKRAKDAPGELIPNSLRTPPDDCQPFWEWPKL